MDELKQKEIVKVCQEFTAGFRDTFPTINGSGWLIVDPMSAFLAVGGYPNTLSELPATNDHPQVLVMQFADGSRLIPAGGDLAALDAAFHNWFWLQ